MISPTDRTLSLVLFKGPLAEESTRLRDEIERLSMALKEAEGGAAQARRGYDEAVASAEELRNALEREQERERAASERASRAEQERAETEGEAKCAEEALAAVERERDDAMASKVGTWIVFLGIRRCTI